MGAADHDAGVVAGFARTYPERDYLDVKIVPRPSENTTRPS